MLKIKNKKQAFTLAEVLITLTIIGVVAAFTIPALINNTNEKELINAAKKNYSALNQAINMIRVNNDDSIIGIFTNKNVMRDEFAKYLSVAQKCDNATNGCWKTPFYDLAGNQVTYFYWLYYDGDTGQGGTTPSGLILNDGTLLAFATGSTGTTSSVDCNLGAPSGFTPDDTDDICGAVYIDVNGFKSPNTQGKDIFMFHITKRGGGSILPWGINPYPGYMNNAMKNCDKSIDSKGYGCSYIKLLK